MKKSVALIIAFVYLGSIVFIAFFGMKLATIYPVIPVESIECINEELRVNDEGEKRIVLNYQEGMVYSLKWKVKPAGANSAVEFDVPPSDNYEVTFFGEIIFYAAESFTVTIRATDGSEVKEIVEILLR